VNEFVIYIKSHVKALGLFYFVRGLGWAYWGGGVLISAGHISRIKKMFRNDEIRWLKTVSIFPSYHTCQKVVI